VIPTQNAHERSDAWGKVRQALENPRWDFRTVDGLVEDTGFSREEVQALLESHSAEIRKANVPDSKGRILYTLATKPMGVREILANTRAFITKTF